MATLPVLPPRIVGVGGLDSPLIASYFPLQASAYREADFVTLTTTGTIVTPAPAGALATAAGPVITQDVNLSTVGQTVTIGAVTFTGVAQASAPATSYYTLLAYTATAQQSLPSVEFVINSAVGVVPSISVSATGAPAGATNFATFNGIFSGGEALQQATTTTTALGAAFTVPYPLVNSTGLQRCITNNAATNLAGLVMHDSAATYVDGIGGSFTANIGTPLGTWMPPPPLGPADPLQSLVAKFTNGQPIEVSLRQAYYPSLIGTTCGLYIDPVSNYFEVDTSQSNKPFTIVEKVFGAAIEGLPGDLNARVKVICTAGAI